MPWGEQHRSSIAPSRIVHDSGTIVADIQQQKQQAALESITFGINTTTPPSTHSQSIMQRVDEVNTVLRMMNHTQTSTVMLVGHPGAGKSTLAALLYNRLLLAQQKSTAGMRHLVWLELSTYTTLPDLIAAILDGINMHEPGLFLLRPEQQITALLHALRRPQENALIVLDQFELLLHPETNQGVAGRGVLSLFLEMLQMDLGGSRIVLTSYNSPYDENSEETRVRSCLVSRISIPEGVALLAQRGVQGSPEELSLVWQRCAGHAFALVLFSALVHLSGISLSYLLNSPDYQPMWSGEVTFHLIATTYHFLNAVQYALMRALSLFSEPVPLTGLIMTITGNSSTTDVNGQLYATFQHEVDILVQLSLVQVSHQANGAPRFAVHSLLRQYALEHYIDTNERRRKEGLTALGINIPLNPAVNSPEALQVALAAGHMHVAAYYQYMAREKTAHHKARKSLQDVQPIVSAIRHLCLGGRWQRACNLLFEENLHECMVHWGAWNALIGLYTAMLPPFATLERRDEALVYSHVGMLYGRMSEMHQSQSYLEQALDIQRQIADIEGEATTLANQGELYRMCGELDLARTNLTKALAMSKQVQNRQLQCIVLHNLGLLQQGEKNYQEALDCYTEALQLAQHCKEQHYQGLILTNLGLLLYEQGLQREAIAVLLAAAHLRQSLQDPSVVILEKFLQVLEEKLGSETYRRLCQSAKDIQQKVFSRFVHADMRQ